MQKRKIIDWESKRNRFICLEFRSNQIEGEANGKFHLFSPSCCRRPTSSFEICLLAAIFNMTSFLLNCQKNFLNFRSKTEGGSRELIKQEENKNGMQMIWKCKKAFYGIVIWLLSRIMFLTNKFQYTAIFIAHDVCHSFKENTWDWIRCYCEIASQMKV